MSYVWTIANSIKKFQSSHFAITHFLQYKYLVEENDNALLKFKHFHQSFLINELYVLFEINIMKFQNSHYAIMHFYNHNRCKRAQRKSKFKSTNAQKPGIEPRPKKWIIVLFLERFEMRFRYFIDKSFRQFELYKRT